MSLGKLLLAAAAMQVRNAARAGVKWLTRKLVPEVDDEEPFPLTHKDVQHQQAQIREATRRRDEIPPPPRVPSTGRD